MLLDSGFSSTTINGQMNNVFINTLVNCTKWSTQAETFTDNFMVKVELSLSVISATKIMTWKCHMDDSTAGRYNMISGRDLLTTGENWELFWRFLFCT